ncbi:MAG TPA: Hpt domain-containing protein, partial [Desulfuromonadaceae bacterium]
QEEVRPDAAGAETETGLPEELAGFDLKSGLALLCGNHGFYRQMILNFAQRDGGAAQELRQLISQGDRTGAKNRSHSLKGVAGTLAASEVFALASELEGVLAQPAGPDEDRLLGTLEAALQTVVRSAGLLGGGGAADPPSPAA